MSILTRLYRGETNFNFIGTRKRWYFASLVLLIICVLSMAVRGFNVGIDFKGGTQFQIKASNTSLTTQQVERALEETGHPSESAAQEVGSGATRQIVIKTAELSLAEQSETQRELARTLGVDPKNGISVDSVSSSWGSEITKKAIQGLLVFLVVVFAYIALRFEVRMAMGAMVALLHDLVVAAGIYSLVGFELTPSTIVGLLTILGFSLYDTVVVFDKVAENTRDLLSTGRETYATAANRAVNQTLMRSVNTSVISLLPVGGLLFVGAGMLGVGTIKDLALILFIGLTVGMYSSLFLATPVVVDLVERDPQHRALAKRVQAKRASARVAAEEPAVVGAAAPAIRRGAPAPAPRPGARPATRPARKRP
ncbi:MAG TPA: protein translocase subunit SecF [Jatrophihabitans sp.]|jgi:preprotein translocase subunit SecF|uniref:protein translocase subunit SecF n=1 Tax=Jatrophihabitans sp. TaxID=1932789 RepID=UPI002F104D05